MKEKLSELLKNSYSPYYNFKVAAIVVTKDGKMFGGVNVENANGTSICAERHAIGNAVCQGYRKGDFDKLYLMLENGELGYPCFACRQVITEFFNADDEIISVTNDEEKSFLVSTLCPFPFAKEDLK